VRSVVELQVVACSLAFGERAGALRCSRLTRAGRQLDLPGDGGDGDHSGMYDDWWILIVLVVKEPAVIERTADGFRERLDEVLAKRCVDLRVERSHRTA